MKRISFLMALLLSSVFTFGQSLEDIDKLMKKNQFAAAKESIDKYLADAKNAAEADGWYFKGRIYNSLSKDATVKAEDAIQLKLQAFDAFKKYQQLDPKDIRFKIENYLSYFDLYNGNFEVGAKAFGDTHFETAFNSFKNALLIEDYVKLKGYEANGFKFPNLDTSLVLNAAIAARQAKKEDDAIAYYKILADANLTADNFLEVYEYLTDAYARKKDMVAFAAMHEKGKRLYPKESFWEEIEIEHALNGLEKAELYNKYEELMAKYPTNYVLAYNYAVDLYKSTFDEEKPTQAVKDKIVEVTKKALAIKETADANFLLANFYYNTSYDYTDAAKAIKGAKPEDVKKRKELNDASKKAIDNSIPYAVAAVNLYAALPKLKPIEKVNYKQILDMLIEIYQVKGDVKKQDEYKAKKTALGN